MAEDARWRLDADRQQIDGFDVELDLNVSSPQIEAATLETLSALLAQIGVIHGRIREVITRDFATLPLLKDDLLPGLFCLEEAYRASLFPDCASADAVGPDAFLDALTMCRVGYYDHFDVSGQDRGEALIVDYRFLVGELLPADMHRQEMFLRFQNRYDITNQVVTARVGMDGTVMDVSIKS